MIWLDLATDGNGNILELALIETTPDLEIKAEKSWQIRPADFPTDADAEEFLAAMPERVLNMHRDNGLLVLCMNGPSWTLAEAEAEARTFVQKCGGGAMHGEGCDYDRAHLREHMPALNQLFEWHSFDVASLQILTNDMCKSPLPSGKKRDRTYRALDDLKRSIARTKLFRLRYMNIYMLKAKP